jgi:HD-like signal output (HDOD) protein
MFALVRPCHYATCDRKCAGSETRPTSGLRMAPADRRARVEKALQSGIAFPAGPVVMARVTGLCRDPNATARDLGKVLQLDATLTSRVLKQVNSVFYGLSAKIKTVTHAVVILGFDEIKHIALSVPVANLYQQNAGKPGLDVLALWDRTVQIACLTRAFSYHINHPVPEQTFVAAILADVGMVILNNILAEDYAAVADTAPDDEALAGIELAELGISHIEVGVRLAQKWQFPPELIQAIHLHHAPVENGQVHREAGLVCTARRTLDTLADDVDFAMALGRLPAEVVANFALTADSLAQSWEKAAREMGEAKTILAVD